MVLEVKNLRKKFGNFQAIDDISFEVEEGQILGFLGPFAAVFLSDCYFAVVFPENRLCFTDLACI